MAGWLGSILGVVQKSQGMGEHFSGYITNPVSLILFGTLAWMLWRHERAHPVR